MKTFRDQSLKQWWAEDDEMHIMDLYAGFVLLAIVFAAGGWLL